MPRSCSTSAPASARRDCARTSTSPSSRSATKIRPKYLRALEDERFDILPGAHVHARASCARTPSRSASTGSRSSTSTTRASRRRGRAPLRARRVPARQRRTAVRASRGSRSLALAAIAVATALVIAAWKFGGPEGEKVPGLATRDARRTSRPSGAAADARSSCARRRGARGWRFARRRRRASSCTAGTLERGQRKPFDGPRAPARARRARERRRSRERQSGRRCPPATTFVVTPQRIARPTS